MFSLPSDNFNARALWDYQNHLPCPVQEALFLLVLLSLTPCHKPTNVYVRKSNKMMDAEVNKMSV